ncbi:hypothetical protein I308_104203 [Cryptococcus tetragattii IND107]|uniref:RRM domain-containing protein n=1 Tax=Cryptococcus tetragattii IND107 TaxID=1296105 RepID=A0ABR3BPP9_9TREE
MIYDVFEQYGPIEDIRVLPEKTCAFVNFVKRSNAIFAHGDVLHCLGDILPTLSRTAPVLLGFGKTDALLKKEKVNNASCFFASKGLHLRFWPQELSKLSKYQMMSPPRSCLELFRFLGLYSRILPRKRHGFINFENLALQSLPTKRSMAKIFSVPTMARFRLILSEFPLELQVI